MIDFNDCDLDRHDDDVQHGDEAAWHEPQHRMTGMRDGATGGGALDDGRAQAMRILQRNRELTDGNAVAGPEGEREVGVGRTVNSDRSHHGGDYSSD
jgi:hypothetical protein